MTAEAGNAAPSSGAPHYAAAGVDVEANTRLIARYHALAEAASRPEVVGGIGAFSGLFDLSGYAQPLLVASTDGVGTKVLLAPLLGRYDTVGQDLVNHCVNDILTAGARPLFFLDYLAGCGLSEDQKVAIVAGVARACRETGTALLGGETADMPGLYRPGDFDLAGTIVGVVEKGRQIDGARIAPGDLLVGLPSNGLHTNGYSLLRSIFQIGGDPEQDARLLATHYPGVTETFGEALLRPHRCYWPLLAPVLDRCKGIAHITGGGIAENLARALPRGVAARVRRGAWPEPPLFGLIQRQGALSDAEMFRVFNMGLGLIAVVAPADLRPLQAALGEAYEVGQIVAAAGPPTVEIVSTAA